MVSEQEKAKIQKEAKQILENFAKSLEKVKFKESKVKEQLGGFREEQEGKEADPDFRKRFFDNAPQKDGDFIIAEKKKW